MMDELVVVRGCGDIGTGVMHRLFCSGFKLVGLDIDKPTAIRRQVAFAQALYDGSTEVEGISAVKIDSPQEALGVIAAGQIPLLNDPNAVSLDALRPGVLIDAALAKRNLGTHIGMAPIVIALGPGFYAGRDAHAVIETNRGHNLGRVIYVGSAAAPTGTPGKIGGFGAERLIRAPATGAVRHEVKIGNLVQKGDLIAHVGGTPVFAPLAGMLRGLIHEGVTVGRGLKIGDIDPRGDLGHCDLISDKARAIGGGVLEAILHLRLGRYTHQ